MGVTSDRFQTPTAAPMCLKRVGDLSGDEEKDRKIYDDRRASLANLLEAEAVDEKLRAMLTPDIGPKAHAEGGQLLLRALFDPAITYGTPAKLNAKS